MAGPARSAGGDVRRTSAALPGHGVHGASGARPSPGPKGWRPASHLSDGGKMVPCAVAFENVLFFGHVQGLPSPLPVTHISPICGAEAAALGICRQSLAFLPRRSSATRSRNRRHCSRRCRPSRTLLDAPCASAAAARFCHPRANPRSSHVAPAAHHLLESSAQFRLLRGHPTRGGFGAPRGAICRWLAIE